MSLACLLTKLKKFWSRCLGALSLLGMRAVLGQVTTGLPPPRPPHANLKQGIILFWLYFSKKKPIYWNYGNYFSSFVYPYSCFRERNQIRSNLSGFLVHQDQIKPCFKQYRAMIVGRRKKLDLTDVSYQRPPAPLTFATVVPTFEEVQSRLNAKPKEAFGCLLFGIHLIQMQHLNFSLASVICLLDIQF